MGTVLLGGLSPFSRLPQFTLSPVWTPTALDVRLIRSDEMRTDSRGRCLTRYRPDCGWSRLESNLPGYEDRNPADNR